MLLVFREWYLHAGFDTFMGKVQPLVVTLIQQYNKLMATPLKTRC